ncbi:MAG: [FeFe] hydrogenase H-cluster radical SAM maturase HydE [Chitinispirillaceae bacterium]|nr:[FeFe] hydrogenase H-cluster radical SAM maturase HydE [Chitinispirillaceae bacterium]
MCYALPGRIKSIDGKHVIVEYYGEEKKAINELRNLEIGDFVYAQGGYVIEKITPVEASNILETWKDLFFELKSIDASTATINFSEFPDSHKKSILQSALEGAAIADSEILELLSMSGEPNVELLYQTANHLRQRNHDNSCCVHGIIELSNICKNDCAYCGISTHNTSITRYRMNKDEIMAAVKQTAVEYGFKSLVLQSGEGAYSVEELVDIVKTIKKNYPSLICISFGEVGFEGLKALYEAGARAILMRFETSNPDLYSKVCPGRSLEKRVREIREAYRLGYLVTTGSLIGIPGQSSNDILNDIKLTSDLHAEMMSFGPFISHPETPLRQNPSVDEETMLKVIAIARIIAHHDAKVLVTTAFETISGNARIKGLKAGASSVMLNATPLSYRKFYSLYPNRAHDNETIPQQIDDTIKLLMTLGRAPTDLSVK